MKSISLMAVLLVAAGTVQADAREEVMQAYEKAMAEESYRVQSRSEHRGRTQQSTIDIQPPDRFHMRSPESEVIVLPGGTWMNQGGQWMKLPMDMSSMIKGLTLSAMRDGANSVQDVREIGSGEREWLRRHHLRLPRRGQGDGCRRRRGRGTVDLQRQRLADARGLDRLEEQVTLGDRLRLRRGDRHPRAELSRLRRRARVVRPAPFGCLSDNAPPARPVRPVPVGAAR
jgi:Ni/Co efflux regulator RcnB